MPPSTPPPAPKCNHPPVMNPGMTGNINPMVHYGDGYDGYVTCCMCRSIVGEVDPKTHRIRMYEQ